MPMLTRARARATNQPIFVDDKWNDAYIQTKDEQIEMLHMQRVLKSWEDEEDSELEEEGDGGEASEDRWISDDDEEDEDDGDNGEVETLEARRSTAPSGGLLRRWLADGAWLENVAWTAMCATVVPVALYVFAMRCLRRRRRSDAWPLRSASVAQALTKMATNMVVAAVLLVLLHSWLCGDELAVPTVAAVLRLPSAVEELPQCASVLLDDWYRLWASEDRTRLLLATAAGRALLVESVGAVALVATLGLFHRLWFKTLVLATTVGAMSYRFAVDSQAAQRTAVKVLTLDPMFAFANESIFIAIDGQNLQQGATIAWVPYWNGLQQRRAGELDKLYAQPLRHGGVAVVFDQLNEFAPCYAADGGAFACFPHLRLRVKDARSVPGWSLHGAGDDL